MKQDLNIDERLLRAQVAIDNARTDAEILEYLSRYKYDTDRLDEGWALYETAQALHQYRKTRDAEKQAATAAVNAAKAEAHKAYIKNVKIARVALEGNVDAFIRLNLNGRRKRDLSGRLSQARQFYLNALGDEEILAELDTFGITSEMLQTGKQLVDEVETANALREKERGEARQATRDRNTALQEMNRWMRDYETIARIALEEKPQFLEKLGFKEPS